MTTIKHEDASCAPVERGARTGREISYTLTETGKVLTETQHGITMPTDYSFSTVNDYVHGIEVDFEDLQALCLGMTSHIDKLRRGEFICIFRKDGEHDGHYEF